MKGVLLLALAGALTGLGAVALMTGCVGGLGAVCAAAASETEPTAIVVDERTHVIRVMVDGREVARFDNVGLRVNGDIGYSGKLKDEQAPAKDGGP